jgi:hypothetical protein
MLSNPWCDFCCVATVFVHWAQRRYTSGIAFDLVIFTKLDRAFRNTRNALNVLHELKGRGISVHFIDLGGDVTGNGIGAIVFTILSAFATFERERIATRIREMKTMRQTGAGYRGIADWMRATQERKMTFMGVKRTLICADAACS